MTLSKLWEIKDDKQEPGELRSTTLRRIGPT